MSSSFEWLAARALTDVAQPYGAISASSIWAAKSGVERPQILRLGLQEGHGQAGKEEVGRLRGFLADGLNVLALRAIEGLQFVLGAVRFDAEQQHGRSAFGATPDG
jgi:hypothetical protein